MEITNPHNDFLITCRHSGDGNAQTLIARITGDFEVLTERNEGSGVRPVGHSFIAESTQERVAHLACPECPYDIQLQPATLRKFIKGFRDAGILEAELSVLQKFATRPN